ncbi:hypothetical protein [Streptomyces sp. V1I1]|uniref:hypothetical protein n=1 Tax=Streptomyces sp. V1I1 TaxID=3042272 RepID=UPI00278213FD|nr:hypothetical protein [Streptomyces sp. V1I1]MDQ0938382.1 thiamine pyrophosphate-dependent acetolactate synthase large subunit-like protein [Streptomyces sp. V1I1]
MPDRSSIIALGVQSESCDCFPNETPQCLDKVTAMCPLTKFSAQLEQPDDIADLLDSAVGTSVVEPVGPSFTSLPDDREPVMSGWAGDCAEEDSPSASTSPCGQPNPLDHHIS